MKLNFIIKILFITILFTYHASASTLVGQSEKINNKSISINDKNIHPRDTTLQYNATTPLASSSVTIVSDNRISRISSKTLTIFYATDRQAQSPFTGYTNTRDLGQNPIHYGSVIFNDSSYKTFQLNSIDSKDKMLEILNKSKSKKILIFIPGFNMDFKKSITTLANFIDNSGFDGIPIIYSWPSAHNIILYPGDIENIDWSTPYIKEFIEDILTRSNAEEIHILAHSMGSRGLAATFQNSSMNYGNLKSVIFAAPDIDVEKFERDYLKNIINSKALVTIYCSSNDKALLISKILNSKDKRLGEGKVAEKRSIWHNVDIIDVSKVEGIFSTGHSYIFENELVLADVKTILKKAEHAILRKQNIHNAYKLTYTKSYWEMIKEETIKKSRFNFSTYLQKSNKLNLRGHLN